MGRNGHVEGIDSSNASANASTSRAVGFSFARANPYDPLGGQHGASAPVVVNPSNTSKARSHSETESFQGVREPPLEPL